MCLRVSERLKMDVAFVFANKWFSHQITIVLLRMYMVNVFSLYLADGLRFLWRILAIIHTIHTHEAQIKYQAVTVLFPQQQQQHIVLRTRPVQYVHKISWEFKNFSNGIFSSPLCFHLENKQCQFTLINFT